MAETFVVYSVNMTDTELTMLESTMNRKMHFLPERIRPYTTEYQQKNKIPKNLILTGLRGCGKTTFLLYHVQVSGKKILYLSADNPLFSSESLYSQISYIFSKGYDGVIIDEIHFAKDWSSHLKSLYDDYPDRIIWASDSSSLILRNGTADISRRYVFIRMPIMSFREFLFLETGMVYEKSEPFSNPLNLSVQPTAPILSLFTEYKKHGTRPYYQEGNFEERSLAVLDKTLNSDVTFFVPHITDDNLRLMNAVIGTIANAAIPRIQVRSLCSDWNVGAEKLYQLLEVMESVGAIRIIRYQNETKAKSAGAKVFYSDPCLYAVLRGTEGNIRESFVSLALQSAGYQVFAAKDERDGDFVTISSKDGKRMTIEVGGHKKILKNADFVVRDDIDYPADKVIPLWHLLMMW